MTQKSSNNPELGVSGYMSSKDDHDNDDEDDGVYGNDARIIPVISDTTKATKTPKTTWCWELANVIYLYIQRESSINQFFPYELWRLISMYIVDISSYDLAKQVLMKDISQLLWSPLITQDMNIPLNNYAKSLTILTMMRLKIFPLSAMEYIWNQNSSPSIIQMDSVMIENNEEIIVFDYRNGTDQRIQMQFSTYI